MRPEPEDRLTGLRMRTARARACTAFGLVLPREAPEIWGWHGRTIAAKVLGASGPAWLRIAHSATHQIIGTFWTGAIEAQQQMPPSIPRPRLRQWQDWVDEGWAYRAELYDYVASGAVSDNAVLTDSRILPSLWWADVRAALDAIAAVRTRRLTIQPGFLTWAMPRYLGISHAEYTGIPWTTAHGDFHLANLCAPKLSILDWEGWGLAPPGYDAATLHAHSLRVPETAQHVRRELGHLFSSEAGQYAELAVLTELLHTSTEGSTSEITSPLRQRAHSILGRRHSRSTSRSTSWSM